MMMKTDIYDLALKAHRHSDVDVQQLIRQQQGQQLAEQKLPLWAATEGIEYPHHLSLEQCSSQLTASYKASLVNDNDNKTLHSMTDLTGGFGVDAAIMGRLFTKLTFVEKDAELCRLARHNLPLLGVNQVEVVNSDCQDYLPTLPHQNLIFIDPARRDKNGCRTFAISDCTPDVSALNQLLLEKADCLMIKLSPMLDITAALRQLQGVTQVHIVSVQGECKEILVLLNDNENENSPLMVCVDITREGIQRFCFTREDEQQAQCTYTPEVGAYLYEPNASLMKASPFRSLAQHYHLQKLHPNSHLYTSMEWIPDFPGRQFRVEDVLPFNKQATKQISQLRQANISVRNFPATVADLRKRFHLADGGDTYLFVTTLADNRRVVILCKK